MANLITTGTTSYPASLDTRTAVVDDPGGTQVVANHINGPAAATIAIETELGTAPRGTAADVSTRLGIAHNADGTVKSSVVAGPGVSYASGIFTVTGGNSAQGIYNLGLAVHTAASSITVGLRQQAGVKPPDATNPASVEFRSTVAATGSYIQYDYTSIASLTIPLNATLGFGTNEYGRIYVYGVHDGSTAYLGVCKKAIFDEGSLWTTTAISAGGATDSDTLYTPQTVTGGAVRCLGFLEVRGGAPAGTWSNAHTQVVLMGPGIKRTGQPIQYHYATITATSGTSIKAAGAAAPASSVGDNLWTKAITLAYPSSTVVLKQVVLHDNSGNDLGNTCYFFRGSTCVGSQFDNITIGTRTNIMASYFIDRPGTAASVTYQCRMAVISASTWYVNQLSGGNTNGGTMGLSGYELIEVSA